MSSPSLLKPVEQSVGIQLATFLADRRDQIISEWAAAVHRDRKIATSEVLAHDQLREHVSQLLDSLTEVVANAFSQDLKKNAARTAAMHGHTRYKAGYDISELLREMRDLRATLIPHLIEFEEHHPEVGASRKLYARTTMHRFLDDMMRIAVEQFIVTDERFKDSIAIES